MSESELPPLKTFRAIVKVVDSNFGDDRIIVAHAYTCEENIVRFYTYELDVIEDKTVLVARATRTLWNWLDIEDITADMAIVAGSKRVN